MREVPLPTAMRSRGVIDRSTIWPYDEHGEPRDFYYSRYDSPTVAAAEHALGELEGGEALLFPSGAGATTALVLSLLQPGDTIALAAGAYYGTGVTFSSLHKWGLNMSSSIRRARRPTTFSSSGSRRRRIRS